MRRFNLQEIKAALAELDTKLEQPAALTLIGGAAVALTLDDQQLVTKDIDAFGISRTLLVTRYRTEMTHAVGDPRRLWFNFLECVETLFGAVMRGQAAISIPEP